MQLFNIDTATEDGRNIRVITENDSPSVGDAVVQVAEDGSEADVPDGEYAIPDLGIIIETAMGAIVAISQIETPPTVEETPQFTEPTEAEMQLSAVRLQLSTALAEVDKLKAVIAAKEKRIEQLSKMPVAKLSTVKPDADGVPPVETVKKFSADTYQKIKK